MARVLTNITRIDVPGNQTLNIGGTGAIKVPGGTTAEDGRYIRKSLTSLTFPALPGPRAADILAVEGDVYSDWLIPGLEIFIYSELTPSVWASGVIVSYSHPNLEIQFDDWVSDTIFHNDWCIGSQLEFGAIRYNSSTSSTDLVVPALSNATASVRVSDGSPATYLKLGMSSGTFATANDLILDGTETTYTSNQSITASHNKRIVKLNSAVPCTFAVSVPGTLGAKFYCLLMNINTGNLIVTGNFEDGTTSFTLLQGQSMLLISNGITNKLAFKSNGKVQTIQQGNNIVVDNADPFNPIVHATIPLLVEGHGISINNADVHNPVVSAKDFFIVPASDETSALTVGNAKVTFRAPYAFTLTGVRGSLNVAQTSGSLVTVDIKRWNGSSFVTILSTLLTFDNGERTTVTAATAPVLSYTNIVDDEELRIDVTQVGDGTAKGLKITLLGQ